MNLSQYLIVSAILFGLGAFGVITRRNAIAVLMGVELMLNAANLNFVAFWRFLAPTNIEPQVFVLIGITVAAAEAAVGLALIISIYRHCKTTNVDEVNSLKG